MKRIIISAMVAMTIIFLAESCKHETLTPEDQELYEAATDPNLYYYQSNNVILDAEGNSPHGSFKLRFNQIAWDALGPDGRLPVGATFPEGALVVKEVYSGNDLDLIAIMKKSNASNSARGWLWNEMNPDGSVHYGVDNKGSGCTGCHSGNTNRDLVNSFDLH
ncbi:MAG: cytochrome P460 family protein [Chitinophagales bacterium]|nr:cytochrome P460 family protein [Chitinophagales bacterium]